MVLLVITSGIASKFEDFGSKIYGCTSANTLGIVSLLQKTVDMADKELRPAMLDEIAKSLHCTQQQQQLASTTNTFSINSIS